MRNVISFSGNIQHESRKLFESNEKGKKAWTSKDIFLILRNKVENNHKLQKKKKQRENCVSAAPQFN